MTLSPPVGIFGVKAGDGPEAGVEARDGMMGGWLKTLALCGGGDGAGEINFSSLATLTFSKCSQVSSGVGPNADETSLSTSASSDTVLNFPSGTLTPERHRINLFICSSTSSADRLPD